MTVLGIELTRSRIGASILTYIALCSGFLGLMCILASTTVESTETSGHLWWKETTANADAGSERFGWFLAALIFLGIAAACGYWALRISTQAGRLRKYPPILKGVESMPVQRVADIAGVRVSTAYRDLRTLISSGTVDEFYIDNGSGTIVNKSYVPERSQKAVVECPGCGTRNEVIIGIPKSCKSCGEPVALRFSNDT
ncbi:hypothetical protein QE370_002901 [Aeromicrobium sp. SORGH_AS981]|uniref:hypothetical protein n=1 Tax=Aeromicrobium sp. SORGH_AS_0981 TaxID=3041802 RepID=UPI002856DBA4|nr:hypothetical protein [Aeromicrobium sp. SORGH_AS_0981]MDR6119717.1 hypothetical protein [Aeromicrobium sp. SORGH_AS_0981]